ncbi:hypothetical protein B7L70_10340 [Vulcanisaeta sp. EB80]|nr:hypothetical protein B7L70_10340 [Vulcanisaeta sp. EB80]
MGSIIGTGTVIIVFPGKVSSTKLMNPLNHERCVQYLNTSPSLFTFDVSNWIPNALNNLINY